MENLNKGFISKGKKVLDVLYRTSKYDGKLSDLSFPEGTEEYELCCLAVGMGLMNYCSLASKKENKPHFMVNDAGYALLKKVGING